MKLKLHLLHLRFQLKRLSYAIVDGYWLTLADLLWAFPIYREAYYAHRERAWRGATDYLTFAQFLRQGGWKIW